MYTYCGNDPINAIDPSGHIPNRAVMMTDGSTISDYARAWSNKALTELEERQKKERSVFNKIDKYLNNTNEQVVLDAKVLAFYKGVPVLKVFFMGDNAFSYGMIFMGNGKSLKPIDVQHEYGHCVQFQKIGSTKFAKYVAAPSLPGFWTDVPTDQYYSQPWEYGADVLGGVNRASEENYVYSSTAESDWLQYWDAIMN